MVSSVCHIVVRDGLVECDDDAIIPCVAQVDLALRRRRDHTSSADWPESSMQRVSK